MRGFVRHLRSTCGYLVLPYIDDFLVAAAPPGRAATEEDAAAGRQVMLDLFDRLGIVRKVGKECWEGSRKIDHLGMHIDTKEMQVFVADKMVERVRRLLKKMLLFAQRNRRLVSRELVQHFYGVCVVLPLALALARFYTRSLFFDPAGAGLEKQEKSLQRRQAPKAGAEDFAHSDDSTAPRREAPGQPGRVRPSRQSLRDLRFWRRLTRGEGRELRPCKPDMALHSDAADVEWGNTLGPNIQPGSPGLWEGQGF